MKLLTQQEKEFLANLYKLEYKAVNAVYTVESSGSGFDPNTGLIKIQFEPHWFEKYTKTKIMNGVEGQPKEWAAFEEAAKSDLHSAIMSTSWGLGQVMGFNHKSAGYITPEAMVDAFKESEYNQLKGMLEFIKNTPSMFAALQAKDWAIFAKFYNGPLYKNFNYDTRLAAAYAKS